MNTAVINIRIEAETKKAAQEVAKELGLSLSALVTTYLKRLVKTKKVTLRADEVPSKGLILTMKKAEENYKAGKASPIFDNAKDAIDFLEQHGI